MTNIEIEKKGRSLWWLWLLIALAVLAAIIWFVLADRDDAARPVEDVSEISTQTVQDYPAPATTAEGPINDIALLTAVDATALVGREVALTDVDVGDVVGDASFWITAPDGGTVYVVLDEVRTPSTSVEGQADVDTGDRVNLTGTVRTASEDVPSGAAMGTQTDPIPQGVTEYILAQTVEVVS